MVRLVNYKCKSLIKLTPGSLLENVAKSKERTKGEGEREGEGEGKGEGREGSTLAPYLPTRSLFTVSLMMYRCVLDLDFRCKKHF